jgi:UDPglucose 6-dehydrogenase
LTTRTRVAFIGLGYVGLSTAVCLASQGFSVHGIDVDQARVRTIAKGVSPIHETGLESLLRASIRKKTFSLGYDYRNVARSKVIFLTVGTPSREDGSIDTSYIEAAAREVGRQLASSRGYHLVIVKSTVVPGTTEGLVRPILERWSGKKVGKEIGLASNPEFLHEGTAILETLHPEAIVIGGADKKSFNGLLRLYESFYRKLPPVIETAPSNAEMMKYAINVGRVTQLSFINTVANLCSRIPGCDYDEVRKGLSVVARMDERYLVAGLGFGGSCLGKDSRALAATLRHQGAGDDLVVAALRVNDGQVGEAIRLAEKLCGSLDGKKVAVLGLAFKANTDDIRESTAISLTKTLVRMGAEIMVYDPVAMGNTKKVFGSQVTYAKSARDCIRGAVCAFIATGWDQFRRISPRDFRALMGSPNVVDGRRIYDQSRFLKAGVNIATIGTGPLHDGRTSPPGGRPTRENPGEYSYSQTFAGTP